MLNKKKLLHDLFLSYYEARKNKRNTLNQLDFEFNLETNLIELYEELINWTYEVWKSIYFIQNYPVKREIFAWDFRDRIVHHLIYNYISPIFEKEFIYDSYSCRNWKWTSFGIKRLQKFIRSCSENYTSDCYILKLDISWYFMSINKKILFEKVQKSLEKCRGTPCGYPFLFKFYVSDLFLFKFYSESLYDIFSFSLLKRL
jgi:RNA-directed DNA polymerase